MTLEEAIKECFIETGLMSDEELEIKTSDILLELNKILEEKEKTLVAALIIVMQEIATRDC